MVLTAAKLMGKGHHVLYYSQNPQDQPNSSFQSKLAVMSDKAHTTNNLHRLLSCRVSLTSKVKIACDRDDALLRRVDPTERCLFAILIANTGQAQTGQIPDYAHVYNLLNWLTSWIGTDDRFATKTWPASFSLTGNLGAYKD